MAGVNASLRAYLWQGKTYDAKAKREVWTIGDAGYEGYRNYIKKVKEEGFPAGPAPQPDDIELARLPTTQSAALEMPVTGQEQGNDWQQQGGQQDHQNQQQQVPQQEEGSSQPPLAVAAVAAAAAAPAGDGDTSQQQRPDLLPGFAFRHAYDVSKCAVSVLKFARGSAELLAWGAADGVVYVATAESPPRLLQVLERHSERMTDLDWSPDGTMLLSCSQDGTACLWQPEAGVLVRTLRNQSGPLGCCRFHPANTNLLLLGTAAGELLALNASTGHLVAKAELEAAPMARVGAACLEAAGPGRLLVADSRGCLHLFAADLHSGQMPRLQPLAHFPPPGNRFHEPACLEYAAHSLLARGPAVLLVQSSGEVVLSRLHDKPWRLELKREVRTATASAKIRASLRPGVALERPEVLLCGGEDCKVHLVDVSCKAQPPRLLAALAAHSAPVLGVAWSEDESRLASCDKRGVVVVWEAVPSASAPVPASPVQASSVPARQQ